MSVTESEDRPAARQAPGHLLAGEEIGGVDQQRVLQIVEGAVAHDGLEQRIERLAPVEGGGVHPAEGHVHVGHAEDVPALHGERTLLHFVERHAGGPGPGHHGAHARAHDHRRLHASLVQRLEHADVSQTLETTATQHQRERTCTHRFTGLE